MPPNPDEFQRITSFLLGLGFNADTYLRRNADLSVFSGSVDKLVDHFLAHGFAEGRQLIFKSDGDIDAKLAALGLNSDLTDILRKAVSAAHFEPSSHGRIPPIHTLIKTTASPRKKAEVVVLVRAHVLDEKFHHLYDALRSGQNAFDVYALFDRRAYTSDPRFQDFIWHGVEDCPGIGMLQKHNNLFWMCGDIPLCIAYTHIPDYKYYVMLESDVHFRHDAAGYFNRLTHALTSLGADEIDGAFLQYHEIGHGSEEAQNWPHAKAAFNLFPRLHYAYFPLVVVSNRGVLRLFAERQLEGARGASHEDLVHCEAFTPSCLKAAGLHCTDLNLVLPGSYDQELMGLNHFKPNRLTGLPLGFVDSFPHRSEMIHSVYGHDEFLQRNLKASADDPERLKFFISVLESEAFPSLNPELVKPFVERAKQKLSA
jgi:hypothetical protein